MDKFSVKYMYDITKYNGKVRIILDSMATRNETTNDILTNLFKGYQAETDGNFVKYIT